MAQEGRDPYLVAEVDHTIVVIGDHQSHRPESRAPAVGDWQQFDRHRIDDSEARALVSRVRSAF
jgi:hypothetical protein